MNAAATVGVSAMPADLLDGYSFEISARDAVKLAAIRPLVPADTIVSITHLTSETDEARIAAARELRRQGLVPMPHIAARRIGSRASLETLVEQLSRDGCVDRLFIVAGDFAEAVGPYPDTFSLLHDIDLTLYGIRAVGVAGHPEGHPQVAPEIMDRALADKLAALTERGLDGEIMTQFAFDADPLVAWIARLRAEGVDNLVRLGLPGPANVGTLLRFAARCGVGASAKVMAKYGASITKLLSTAGPDRLYHDLAARLPASGEHAVAMHLYPFGGLERMARWATETATARWPISTQDLPHELHALSPDHLLR